MEDKRITLLLTGVDKEDGFFRLGPFIQQLQNLSSALKQIDRVLNKKETAYYRVVDLQLSSPGKITVEPIPIEIEKDYSDIICDRFINEINTIKKTGKPTNGLDNKALEAFKNLIAPIEKNFSSVSIESRGSVIELNKKMEANIDVIIAEEESSYGTIKGELELINLHDQANKFYIYPIVGPQKVLCHFPDSLKDIAKKSLECKVSITGLMTYKVNEYFPYKIEVENIVIHPSDNELPNLLDLEGIIPNLTNGLSSEEYVKEIRDEWDI